MGIVPIQNTKNKVFMENVFRTEDYFVGAMFRTSYKPDFLTGFLTSKFRTEDYFVGAMLRTSYKPDFLTGFLISKQTYETEVEGIKFRYKLAIEILRSESMPNEGSVVTCGVKIFPDKAILTEEVTNHLKKEYGFEYITDDEIISDGLLATLVETEHNINGMSNEEFQQLLKTKAEFAITQILPNIVEKLTKTPICGSTDTTCWEYLKNYIVK